MQRKASVNHTESLWNRNYLRVWTTNFLIFFSFMLLTPLLPLYLSETFHADKHTIGIALSGYTITVMLIRPFSGYVVDAFSRAKVLFWSYFFFALCFVAYPLAGSLIAFAVFRTLHGLPFGMTTVSNSTVAIDVLPSSRRAEGIGYYGLSNNVATALSPMIALWLYECTGSFNLLFVLSIVVAFVGLYFLGTLQLSPRPSCAQVRKISLDRFILIHAWGMGACFACLSFSYGVISTYIALYAKEELNLLSGSGVFFLLIALGLIVSRLYGGRSLRKGRVLQNASLGVAVSLVGYFIFAAVHEPWGVYLSALIIGLGNGHMFPAFQTMFINIARNDQRGTANSTLLVSWDVGMGLGVFLGGVVAEQFDFTAAFWMAWIVNALGVAVYYLYVRQFFEQNKLRV
ncbi:MAG: MFS transporter [Bacteroidaceae bacterium]|nr:MFS transporter [Bacteroidaceae bacterium]